MSVEERKPILQDSGVYIKTSGSGRQNNSEHQHLIIQPIEFDHKHRNMYGYFALAASILVLVNYLMIKERPCQISFANGFQTYDLIQSFHLTTLIVGLIVFVLSYFNFAVVIYEFKILFYASASLIFICAGLLIYNAVAIVSAPCVPIDSPNPSIIMLFDASVVSSQNNVFTAGDGIGITVFLFNILAALMMFSTGRRFYQRC